MSGVGGSVPLPRQRASLRPEPAALGTGKQTKHDTLRKPSSSSSNRASIRSHHRCVLSFLPDSAPTRDWTLRRHPCPDWQIIPVPLIIVHAHPIHHNTITINNSISTSSAPASAPAPASASALAVSAASASAAVSCILLQQESGYPATVIARGNQSSSQFATSTSSAPLPPPPFAPARKKEKKREKKERKKIRLYKKRVLYIPQNR